jgi:hypothetical protein
MSMNIPVEPVMCEILSRGILRCESAAVIFLPSSLVKQRLACHVNLLHLISG